MNFVAAGLHYKEQSRRNILTQSSWPSLISLLSTPCPSSGPSSEEERAWCGTWTEQLHPNLRSVPKDFPLERKRRKELQEKWANKEVKFVNKQLPSFVL